MQARNQSILLVSLVCCIYPLLVHIFLTYGIRWIMRQDWKNIRWQNINPFIRKDDYE